VPDSEREEGEIDERENNGPPAIVGEKTRTDIDGDGLYEDRDAAGEYADVDPSSLDADGLLWPCTESRLVV
jgi:hypothetical protein